MSEPVTDPAVDTPEPERPATGDTAPDPTVEVEKWRNLARKHEERAKANADKARRFDELEEASKTEQQKAAEARSAAEKAAADAVTELARLKALLKHGLSQDDADLLGAGTPEEIDARAEKLAARLKAAAPPPPPPAPPATGLGKVGQTVGDVGDLDTQIAAANKAGNWQHALALTNRKLAGAIEATKAGK